jgi:hypothetical protein
MAAPAQSYLIAQLKTDKVPEADSKLDTYRVRVVQGFGSDEKILAEGNFLLE